MEEHVPATSAATSPPFLSTKPTPTSSSTKQHTYDPAELAAQPSDSPSSTSSTSPSSSSAASVSIPDGWRAQPRETDYYAVPIIIAMSVLVAVIVVSSIVASVFMRRKKRRRQRRRSARKGEKVDEGGWRGVVEKVMDPVRSVGRKKGKKRDEDGKGGGPGGLEDEGGAAGAGAGEGGSGGSASGGHRRVRTTGFAAGNRVRPRRRRRREGGDDEDDEGTALTRTGTRSSTSSIAHDTLTARLSARLRGERGDEARRSGAGTTTVFSRDAGSASQVSLTASALSRVPSSGSRRSSLRNAGTAPAQPPDLLFTPADDPSLPDHLPIPGSDSASLRRDRSALSVSSLAGAAEQTPLTPPPTSSFGMLIASDTLPAPGPPAYRPSSSTVQSTRRYGAGDLVSPSSDRGSGAASLAAAGDEAARHGRSRRLFGARRDATEERPVEEDEGEWHWPGEKGRPLATEVAGPSGAGSSGSRARPASLVSAPPSVADGADEDEDEREPPVDRSLFSAHVATDDKATLARLREQRDRTIGDGGDDVAPSAGPSVPEPTAPDFDDEEDLDEEGFERFDPDAPSSSGAAPTALPSSSLLPAPPRPVVQHTSTFSYPRRPAGAAPHISRSTSTLASSTAPLLTPSPATATAQSQDKAALAAAEYAERDEDDALPLYLAGSGQRGVAAREALGMASAPPAALEDDEDNDGEDGFGEVTRNEGEREREGVV
ncbi:hypothetical protein Rhopal_001910-T1 [Rhodotorula paludigena]|uniref:Proteophosphoglycan ppg4 n=1 Tax=Rhodotorula paludigena TaxID=86838 RepID=A0AAV5GIB7_9BASI|nr:hypothetical protein Rhopal_001910-T1 [Rhodotorula paludigena]